MFTWLRENGIWNCAVKWVMYFIVWSIVLYNPQNDHYLKVKYCFVCFKLFNFRLMMIDLSWIPYMIVISWKADTNFSIINRWRCKSHLTQGDSHLSHLTSHLSLYDIFLLNFANLFSCIISNYVVGNSINWKNLILFQVEQHPLL